MVSIKISSYANIHDKRKLTQSVNKYYKIYGGVTFINYLFGSFVLKSCLLPSRI